jgi:steroid delta-isomerase-like uncharacterized protein
MNPMSMRVATGVAMLLAIPIAACGGEVDAVPTSLAPSSPPPIMPTTPSAAPEISKLMTIDTQRKVVAAVRAAMNTQDAKKYSELFAPEGSVDEYGLGKAVGREAIAGGIQRAFNGFPDFAIGVSRVFVKDDVVVEEYVITGTHQGEFNGAKPTNKRIGVRAASVLTFTPEGLIKTEHRYFDSVTIVSQLGLMKAPSRPVEALPTGEPEWHVAKGTPEEGQLGLLAKTINGAFEEKSEASFLGALSENVSWSSLAQPKDMGGRAGAKEFFGAFTKAFPDARFSSVALFSVDDFVISESVMTATHAGQLGPLKPTHKPVTTHGIDIMRVKDGKVASGASYANGLELSRPPP